MSGRLFIDMLLDRLMGQGVPRPAGVRMAAHASTADRSELRALLDLYDRLWSQFRYASPSAQAQLAGDIAERAGRLAGQHSHPELIKQLGTAALALLRSEPAYQPLSLRKDIGTLSPVDIGRLHDDVAHRVRLLTDKGLQDTAVSAIEGLLTALLEAMPQRLVAPAAASGPVLSAGLLELSGKPHHLMSSLLARILAGDEIQSRGLYAPLSRQLYRNLLVASGVAVDPTRPLMSHDMLKPVLPEQCVREPAHDIAARYFANTPLLPLLNVSIPFAVPESVRFEHTYIMGGTGHGKTQTLQHLIAADLQRAPADVPSMVILDSQGDMINNLMRLSVFDPKREGSLADRVLIVDPSDVAYPPALNLFDIHSDRSRAYDQKDREQVLAGIIEIYDYLFAGLLGAELSHKQSVIFRFLTQLMLSIPGATILTLREVLEDANPNMTYVEQLPPTARAFFQKQFFGKSYAATRDQVLRRLYGVLQNPAFERMFASPVNRLDLFDVLNKGGIVFVNASKDYLKAENSSMFGRYLIAQTLKAAFERATLPMEQRRPTFLWIDEASEYFDDNIDNLLIQARKFKLGVVMAHQYLKQLKGNLPASMMTNTSTKLVGGMSQADANAFAPEMRTTSDFLRDVAKFDDRAEFACFVRNHTPRAIRVTVPFRTVEDMEQMSDESYEMLVEASRKRLSSTFADPSDAAPEPDVEVDLGNIDDDDEPGNPDRSNFEPY